MELFVAAVLRQGLPGGGTTCQTSGTELLTVCGAGIMLSAQLHKFPAALLLTIRQGQTNVRRRV
jgi:hypothetical protein